MTSERLHAGPGGASAPVGASGHVRCAGGLACTGCRPEAVTTGVVTGRRTRQDPYMKK